jgi:hypothetical protein
MAYDHVLAFKQSVSIGSIIVTKLDGHAKGGGALSACDIPPFRCSNGLSHLNLVCVLVLLQLPVWSRSSARESTWRTSSPFTPSDSSAR